MNQALAVAAAVQGNPAAVAEIKRQRKAKQGNGKAALSIPDNSKGQTSTADAMTKTPVIGESKLRGTQTAVALSAQEIRSAVVALYRGTDVTETRGVGLLELFATGTQDDVKTALNAKESGFAPKSYERVIISECNTLYRGYLADAAKVAPIMTAPGIGWRNRVDQVRDVLATKRDEVALAKAVGDGAAAFIAAGGKVADLDTAELVEAVNAEREAKQAERDAELSSGAYQGKAMAKRLFKANADTFKSDPLGMLAFIADYRKAFDTQVAIWKGENSGDIAAQTNAQQQAADKA